MALGMAVLLWMLAGSGGHPVQAQDPPAVAADTSGPPIVVSRLRFVGNTFFSEEELRLRVRTRANRRFLGIPGFTWWLWMYRLGDDVGGPLGRALQSIGEAPAYLDPSVLQADLERLRLSYTQEGFRQAEVTARVDTLGEGTHARVTFLIRMGSPTFVRRVAYEGLDVLEPEQRLRLVRGSLLQPPALDADAPTRFRSRQQRFSESLLIEERRRLLAFLRDEGYAAVTRDSIRALVFPVQPDSFDVTFRIQTGPRYRFGGVRFEVVGTEPDAGVRTDTLAIRNGPPEAGLVTVRIADEARLSPRLLARTLQFQPGAWYDRSAVLATKRRLDATGVFAFTAIIPVTDTAAAVLDGAPLQAHRIDLRTRQRHSIRLETFMLQRNTDAAFDNQFGTGLGVSYQNANLLGRGEAFQIRTTGSVAASVDSTVQLASAQAEVTTSLTYPYLISPFRSIERRLRLYDARTRLSLSLITGRRDDLKLIVRGRGTARARLELQHTPTITSLVDVLDVSLSNPDTLGGFSDLLDQILAQVEDPVQRAQLLEDYTQPQINNALRYTFRSARVNPLRRERGYSYEAWVEVGGNLPYLLDRFAFTPGTLEGSLPGLPFFEGDRAESRLLYRQYVRFVADARRYRPLNATSVLAWKLLGGVAQPLGRADVVPFDRRFYSGGSTSVRGWELRSLGPGGAEFDTTRVGDGTTTNILGGDIKLEASLELRNVLVRNVLAADWITVFFTDVGNVWFGPRNPGFSERTGADDGRFRWRSFYRELGVGAGYGLRASWEYLVVRFDLAYRIHDPGQPGSGLFLDPIWKPRLHFGIGHAF